MTEKYKIYLSEDTKMRLINDAELFEFYRNDGSVNLNGFLKELIVNYFEQYRKDNDELLNNMLEELTSVKSLKSKEASVLAEKIITTYINNREKASGKSSVITLTVSGESYNIVQIIENNLLKDNSLSGYIKDMFLSYLSIPRNKREEIIFRQTYEAINKAIAENKVLSFTSTNSSKQGTIYAEPYLIATSKEEQFSYLLCHGHKYDLDHTFRISRLRNVFITSDVFVRSKKTEERLTQVGIRHPHSASSDIHAVIQMTERGKQMYKMIVKNRPAVTEIKGDRYHFDWPQQQLEDYFRRFGKEAITLRPKSLRTKLQKYFSDAAEAYSDKTSH
ncbi:MAG: WYL domain-containing protein [Ruminococcaceae bacterium]|nr:WYL domain-containing protein [Oscillospiraceae bacterium]